MTENPKSLKTQGGKRGLEQKLFLLVLVFTQNPSKQQLNDARERFGERMMRERREGIEGKLSE